jgi:hypothetical protein
LSRFLLAHDLHRLTTLVNKYDYDLIRSFSSCGLKLSPQDFVNLVVTEGKVQIDSAAYTVWTWGTAGQRFLLRVFSQSVYRTSLETHRRFSQQPFSFSPLLFKEGVFELFVSSGVSLSEVDLLCLDFQHLLRQFESIRDTLSAEGLFCMNLSLDCFVWDDATQRVYLQPFTGVLSLQDLKCNGASDLDLDSRFGLMEYAFNAVISLLQDKYDSLLQEQETEKALVFC